jgi:hypothetical protein
MVRTEISNYSLDEHEDAISLFAPLNFFWHFRIRLSQYEISRKKFISLHIDVPTVDVVKHATVDNRVMLVLPRKDFE